MAEIKVKGFDITIENEIGSIRKGVDENGVAWSTEMKHPYGYFDNTIGNDGDEVDVFLGTHLENNFDVFVINQSIGEPKSFDEHKVMFGFRDKEEAVAAYFENYQVGWDGFDEAITFTLDQFKDWVNVKEDNTTVVNQIKNKSMGRIKKISLSGPVETDATLNNLIEQAGDSNLFDTLVLDIASQGGCVEEGLKIMVWMDQISHMGKEVITVVSANAYSIASLIMLAADKRYISKHGEVMVHNPMVPFIEYANANELEKQIHELRMLEGLLQTIYSQFANISIEDIKSLMDNETYLSPDDAVLRGFADEVINVKPKPYSMMAIKKELNMSKTSNILKVVIAALDGSEFVNQMYYNTKGEELQIYQANPAKYSVEDRTSIEEGEVRLSDGTMLSIKDFKIANIEKEIEAEPVAAEPATPEVDPVAPVAPVAAVEPVEPAAPVAVVEPVEPAKPVAETNVGPAPAEPVEPAKAVAQAVVNVTKVDDDVVATLAPAVEPVVAIEPIEPVVPVAAEPVAPAQPSIVEVIQAIDPEELAEEGAAAVEPIAPVEPVAPIAEDGPDYEAMYNDLLARVEALEKGAGSTVEFENLATEAIQNLAKNTSSTFKPQAKKVKKQNEPTGGTSIFTRFKSRQEQK